MLHIFLCDNVIISFNAFMSTFIYNFKRAFPLKTIYVKYHNENTWITQDLKVSSKRKQLFNSFKRITNISRESLDYIERCHITYNKLIKEAKKRERAIDLFWGLKMKQNNVANNK